MERSKKYDMYILQIVFRETSTRFYLCLLEKVRGLGYQTTSHTSTPKLLVKKNFVVKYQITVDRKNIDGAIRTWN